MENFVLVGLFPEVNVLAIFFRFFCRRLLRPGHKLPHFWETEIDKIRIITGYSICIRFRSNINNENFRSSLGQLCYKFRSSVIVFGRHWRSDNWKFRTLLLRSKSKDWLDQYQDKVSRMEQHVYLQTVIHYKNPTKHVGLVQSSHHHQFIKCILFSPWYSWQKNCSFGVKQ